MRVNDGKRYRLKHIGEKPFVLIGFSHVKQMFRVQYPSGYQRWVETYRIEPFEQQTIEEIMMKQYEGKKFRVKKTDHIVSVVDVTQSGKLVVDRGNENYLLISPNDIGAEVTPQYIVSLLPLDGSPMIRRLTKRRLLVGNILSKNEVTFYRVYQIEETYGSPSILSLDGLYKLYRPIPL